MSNPYDDEDDATPEDLPQVTKSQAGAPPLTAMEASRTCEKCGSENVRIISNYNGRFGLCGKCKHSWSISMPAVAVIPGGISQRGLSKRTVMEPDWNMAFEDFDNDIYDPHFDPDNEKQKK